MDPVLNIAALIREARRLADEAQAQAAEEARRHKQATGRDWLGMLEVSVNVHSWLTASMGLLDPIRPEIDEAKRAEGAA